MFKLDEEIDRLGQEIETLKMHRNLLIVAVVTLILVILI